MKFPEYVKIGGLKMKIIFDSRLASSDDRFGECDHMRGRIVLDASQPDDHKELSLLHEIIEKINAENELDLEHRQITSLTNNLYQVLKDNELDFRNDEGGATNG